MRENNLNNEFRLDFKDKKILYQLDLNARQSNTKIAKKVGLSKDVVNYRIKKLQETGFINGFYSIIDFYKLGYFSVRIYIKLQSCPLNKEKEIMDFIVKNKKVFYAIKIDGNFDIGFGTYTKSIYDFEEFYLDFKKHFKEFIGKEQIGIFTKVYHFHRAYLLDKRQDDSDYDLIGSTYNAEKSDKLDVEILKLIANNSRISIVEIAEKLKEPIMTISFRIKQLEKKKIIQAYKFIFDFSKINYEYYKVDLILDDTYRLKELMSYCHSHPNILYIDQTIGGSDFEFDLEVKNKKEFLQIIDELKQKFPEIREWGYFSIREYKKLLYFPED